MAGDIAQKFHTAGQPLVAGLSGGTARMELLIEAGGLLNRLVLGDGDASQDVIAGLDSAAGAKDNPWYRSAPLFPFPNRLAGGHYRFQGRALQFPINEPATGNALHGCIFAQQPEVIASDQSADCASVTLQYISDGSWPGYPFKANVRFRYWLQGARDLSLEMVVINTDTGPIPVGMGWHPYFRLPGALDTWQMQMPGAVEVIIDERMLPTGEVRPFEQFEQLTALGDTRLDTGFVLRRQRDRSRARVRLWSPQAGVGLDIWQLMGPRGLDYVQVFIPPDRQSIAVEPMSCNINAFNNGQGLAVLEPGEKYSGLCGVSLIDLVR